MLLAECCEGDPAEKGEVRGACCTRVEVAVVRPHPVAGGVPNAVPNGWVLKARYSTGTGSTEQAFVGVAPGSDRLNPADIWHRQDTVKYQCPEGDSNSGFY